MKMEDKEKTIPVLIVADWDKSFENAKSRKVDHKSYGQFLLKQGRGYCRMMMEKNGAEIYGTFIALVGIVQSKSHPRCGHLTETGDETGYPLSFEDMAAITRIPVKIIEKSLVVLSSRAVGWIHADTMRIPRGYLEDTSISSEYARYPVLYCMESTVEYCRAEAGKVISPEKKPEPELPYNSSAFLKAWSGLMEIRKAKKAVNSEAAIKLLIAKLNKIAPNESEAIRQLNRAIENSWKTVYPDNDFGKSNQPDPEAVRRKQKAADDRNSERVAKFFKKTGIGECVKKV